VETVNVFCEIVRGLATDRLKVDPVLLRGAVVDKAKEPFITVMGLVTLIPNPSELTINGSAVGRVRALLRTLMGFAVATDRAPLEFTTKGVSVVRCKLLLLTSRGAERFKPRFPPPSKLRGAMVAKPKREDSTVMGGAVIKAKLSSVVVKGALVLSVRALAFTARGALQESLRPCEVLVRGSKTLILLLAVS